MYKIISMTLLSFLLILCAGCIQSLHPIYTEQDIVFEPGLIGQWAEDKSKELWTFSKKGTNSYMLVYTDDKGRQGKFSAHLAKIDGKLFLDLFPEEPGIKENDIYNFHFLPVHTFMYVKQVEPTLQMSYPDPNWLEKFIADNPKAILHDIIDGEIILIASTKDLQAFWLEHLKTEGAFGDSSNMKRKTSVISDEQPNKQDAGDSLKPETDTRRYSQSIKEKRMEIEFIAGFAVITKDPAASAALYKDVLGLPLERLEDYLFANKLPGSKHFGVWPLVMAAQSCFGQIEWPDRIPEPTATIEFELHDVAAVELAVKEMKEKGQEFVHEARLEPWGQTVARFIIPEGILVGLSYTPWLHE